MTVILELAGVTRAFGSLRAVDDVSLRVAEGTRHALIGPNGAGKSTLFNVVGGSLRPTAGRVLFAGRDVTGLPEWRRARLGIARTFQHSSVLLGCTVAENVADRRAAPGRHRRPELPAPGRRGRCWSRRVAAGDRGPGRAGDVAGRAALSHGERRQLQVAMALGNRPRLLLLDEPAAGLSPAETARLSPCWRRCRATSPYCSSSTISTWCSAWPTRSPCCIGRHLVHRDTGGDPASRRCSRRTSGRPRWANSSRR